MFTWDEKYINGKNILKLNYPQTFCDVDFDLSKKEKLCALFARNKTSNRKGELFSKRQDAILWFKDNAPDDFGLYGKGWGEGLCRTRYKIFKKTYDVNSVYKGQVFDKISELKKYKFSICFENWENF